MPRHPEGVAEGPPDAGPAAPVDGGEVYELDVEPEASTASTEEPPEAEPTGTSGEDDIEAQYAFDEVAFTRIEAATSSPDCISVEAQYAFDDAALKCRLAAPAAREIATEAGVPSPLRKRDTKALHSAGAHLFKAAVRGAVTDCRREPRRARPSVASKGAAAQG
mmetsp:Transcript_106322/g.342977  ORF Transcript_106322/g.342977 Transcript_106322/m.342977 type:complete len:164 (+) Transcript_106322:118-609(+)